MLQLLRVTQEKRALFLFLTEFSLKLKVTYIGLFWQGCVSAMWDPN